MVMLNEDKLLKHKVKDVHLFDNKISLNLTHKTVQYFKNQTAE